MNSKLRRYFPMNQYQIPRFSNRMPFVDWQTCLPRFKYKDGEDVSLNLVKFHIHVCKLRVKFLEDLHGYSRRKSKFMETQNPAEAKSHGSQTTKNHLALMLRINWQKNLKEHEKLYFLDNSKEKDILHFQFFLVLCSKVQHHSQMNK